MGTQKDRKIARSQIRSARAFDTRPELEDLPQASQFSGVKLSIWSLADHAGVDMESVMNLCDILALCYDLYEMLAP